MNSWHNNPFDVTKAVDFTDAQIHATWVEWEGRDPRIVLSPGTPIPKILTGGKGGGRTHLLRHYSYPVQCLRHGESSPDAIAKDGYVGIYFRCSGLNASRFAGKGQSEETWTGVFAYYLDIWLSGLVVQTIERQHRLAKESMEREERRGFVKGVDRLFHGTLELGEADSLTDLAKAIEDRQRAIDLEVNNAGLTGTLSVEIVVSPGSLVFGVPQAAAAEFSAFRNTTFVYLIDEYENFTAPQQRYINTLLREKEVPTSFVVGSRRYGIRTDRTLNTDERNKIGSEYELIELEDMYRQEPRVYRAFCNDIVRRRLEGWEPWIDRGAGLGDYFKFPAGSLEDRARRHVGGRGEAISRRRISKLSRHLERVGAESAQIAKYLQFPDNPLHEKLAFFLFYRAWAARERLSDASERVHDDVVALLRGEVVSGRAGTAYGHFKGDLYAQLLGDLGRRPEYFGVEDFVLMSGYLPRNLLVILKQSVRWSLFLGEDAFRGSKIGLKAQRRGIRDASRWFLTDAKGLGQLGEDTEVAVRRLGSLFRSMRYSERPVEPSCVAFETNRQELSGNALRTLDSAIESSLILKVPTGRRDKNTGVLHPKYQINPMLSPLFDLPLGRRGAARFSPSLLNAMFDPSVDERSFAREKQKMLARLRAPFGRERTEQERLKLEGQ